jgi:hypothetical protein
MYLLFQTDGPEHKIIGGYSTVGELHKELNRLGKGNYRIEEIKEGFAMRMMMFLEKIANIEKDTPEILDLVLGKEITEEAKDILIKYGSWITDSKSILKEGRFPFKD